MEETWYPLKNWPGYEISTNQRVRSFKNKYGFGKNEYTDEPTVLEEQTHRLGYKYVNLRKDGRTHKGYIHRLMAETFIPNPDNKLYTGEERVYPSRKAASMELGIPDSYISNIIAGRSPHQTRGWTFEDMPVYMEERRRSG